MKNPYGFFCPVFLFSTLFVSPTFAKPVLTAETSRPRTSTFPLGEDVIISFDANPSSDLKLIIDVRNEFGESVRPQQTVTMTSDDDEAHYMFNAPSDKFGYYEVHAKLSDGTALSSEGTRPAGFIPYAIVPDPATRVDYGDKLSRFGLQGGYNKTAFVIPYLGVRYMLTGYNWERLEPDHPDQFIQDRAKASHAGKRYPEKIYAFDNPIYGNGSWRTYHISSVLGAGLPKWALKENTSGTTCKNFGELNGEGEKALPKFALAQAKAFSEDYKYQGSRYYQVTWEPAYPWCYGGTPKGLVKIHERVYDAIHSSDKNALVAGPTLHIDRLEAQQLKDLLKEGLAKYIDAVSFHPKAPWPPEKNGMPGIIRELVDAASTAKGKKIRFIGTEQGLGLKGTELYKAQGDVRTSLMMLGEGADFDIGFYVADFMDGSKDPGYGYYWNLNPKTNFGTDKLGPKPIVPAYAAMTYFIDGTVSKGRLPNLRGTQLGYAFQRDGQSLQVAWDYDGVSSFRIPPNATICDWVGNCAPSKTESINLSGSPVYVILNTGKK